jgi:UDP-N-acetyl-D-mannosaminuronate dehydrogenase
MHKIVFMGLGYIGLPTATMVAGKNSRMDYVKFLQFKFFI